MADGECTYYSNTHEWIRVKDGRGVVGISKHARESLGGIIYVQLPELGKEVKAGEEVVVLESAKAAADIYTPVSGKVVGVNEALKENIDLINVSPEREGYLFEIVIAHPEEIENLILQSDYVNGLEG